MSSKAVCCGKAGYEYCLNGHSLRYCSVRCRLNDSYKHRQFCSEPDASPKAPTIDDLCLAAKTLDVALMRSLLESKDVRYASVNDKPHYDEDYYPPRTPLEKAFYANPHGTDSPWRTKTRKLQVITLLLQAKADPNISVGSESLLCCTWWLKPDLVHLLIDYGANPNTQHNGWTPLWCAVKNEASWSTVEALLERGADAGVTGVDGKRLLDLVRLGWKNAISNSISQKTRPILEIVLTRDTSTVVLGYLTAF